jgi:uncharacterized protein YecT (DUF1311 family)
VKRVVLLLLLAVATLLAEEAGLASAKAAFAKADRNLNDAWMAVKKVMPDKVFAELKAQQRTWIEGRDRQAKEASGAGDVKASAAYWERAAKLTEERAEWLRRRANNEADPLTGVWSDGNGGLLEILDRKNHLIFAFHIVRGRGDDVGFLAGTATWNTSIGWFSDKGRDPEKTDETNISFAERDGHLEVIGANTSHYHGHHAYFDGSYYRIAPLTEEEQQAIGARESGKVPEK